MLPALMIALKEIATITRASCYSIHLKQVIVAITALWMVVSGTRNIAAHGRQLDHVAAPQMMVALFSNAAVRREQPQISHAVAIPP